jgi:hypothetical protein
MASCIGTTCLTAAYGWQVSSPARTFPSLTRRMAIPTSRNAVGSHATVHFLPPWPLRLLGDGLAGIVLLNGGMFGVWGSLHMVRCSHAFPSSVPTSEHFDGARFCVCPGGALEDAERRGQGAGGTGAACVLHRAQPSRQSDIAGLSASQACQQTRALWC